MRFWGKVFAILSDLYVALWKNTSGRPWTYVFREWVDKHPKTSSIILPFVFGAVLVSSRLLKVLPDGGWWWFFTILTAFAWFLAGHLWWDTAGAYIPKPKRYRPMKEPKAKRDFVL